MTGVPARATARAAPHGLIAALAAGAAALGGLAAVVIGSSDVHHHREWWVAGTLLIGWGFVGAGLTTWWRQPRYRVGPLMACIGFCALLSSFAAVESTPLFQVGFTATGLMLAGVTHLLLAFPSGRIYGTTTRALCSAAYLLAVPLVVLSFPWLEPSDFGDCRSCPRILTVASDDGDPIQQVVALLSGITGATIGISIVVLLLRRRQVAGPRLRRALDPVIASGALVAGLFGVGFAGVPNDVPGAPEVLVAGYVALGTLPYAYLLGLARARLGEVSDLESENRRLEDELRARLTELQASRSRLLDAGLEARRKIERDLHDGAQQRFVTLALSLRLARRNAPDEGPLAELIETAEQELATGLRELRELARGIHPAVLTERGLAAAVRSLADHCAVHVTLGELPDRRFPPALEATAYFVVSEALTNVAKYANASEVRVDVAGGDAGLRVEVSDDGAGGADPTAGSGLRGLADRVAAVDGRFEVHSPPGRGTRLVVMLPL